jgi:hypothetical protein
MLYDTLLLIWFFRLQHNKIFLTMLLYTRPDPKMKSHNSSWCCDTLAAHVLVCFAVLTIIKGGCNKRLISHPQLECHHVHYIDGARLQNLDFID